MEITLVGIINDVNDEQPSRALLLIEVILLLKVISHGFSVHKLQQPLPLLLVQVAIIAPNAFRIMGNVGARVGAVVGIGHTGIGLDGSAAPPIDLVTAGFHLMHVKGHLKNTEFSSLVTLSGIVTDVSDEQSIKVAYSRVVILLGIVTEVSDEHD